MQKWITAEQCAQIWNIANRIVLGLPNWVCLSEVRDRSTIKEPDWPVIMENYLAKVNALSLNASKEIEIRSRLANSFKAIIGNKPESAKKSDSLLEITVLEESNWQRFLRTWMGRL